MGITYPNSADTGISDSLKIKISIRIIFPEEITDLIYDSIKLRYRSDVPVSILLSRGLDSGIIAKKVTDELVPVYII
ncbi:MAG: asparagine synthase-related protein [Ignavibacteria bacterium]